jgi:hypothetical protein
VPNAPHNRRDLAPVIVGSTKTHTSKSDGRLTSSKQYCLDRMDSLLRFQPLRSLIRRDPRATFAVSKAFALLSLRAHAPLLAGKDDEGNGRHKASQSLKLRISHSHRQLTLSKRNKRDLATSSRPKGDGCESRNAMHDASKASARAQDAAAARLLQAFTSLDSSATSLVRAKPQKSSRQHSPCC